MKSGNWLFGNRSNGNTLRLSGNAVRQPNLPTPLGFIYIQNYRCLALLMINRFINEQTVRPHLRDGETVTVDQQADVYHS